MALPYKQKHHGLQGTASISQKHQLDTNKFKYWIFFYEAENYDEL